MGGSASAGQPALGAECAAQGSRALLPHSRRRARLALAVVWNSAAPENAAQFRKIVDVLTGDALERGITYKNSAGEQYTSTLEDILTHVFMHGSYHRGQIASLIRAAGDTPSPTDYIFFTRGSPAATRQR